MFLGAELKRGWPRRPPGNPAPQLPGQGFRNALLLPLPCHRDQSHRHSAVPSPPGPQMLLGWLLWAFNLAWPQTWAAFVCPGMIDTGPLVAPLTVGSAGCSGSPVRIWKSFRVSSPILDGSISKGVMKFTLLLLEYIRFKPVQKRAQVSGPLFG